MTLEQIKDLLIHFGNFYTNSKGCVLIGKNFKYINKDKQIDITSSKKSLKKLTSYFLPNIPFNITIDKTMYQKEI